MKNKAVILLVFALCMPILAQKPSQEKDLHFTPAQVESMLFLYNQTTVKGSEVEIVAPVGAKLKACLKEARALKDTTKMILLKFNPTQAQVCLNIIQNSTFEAKYAELVLGMKHKLQKLFPTVLPPNRNAGSNQKVGDK